MLYCELEPMEYMVTMENAIIGDSYLSNDFFDCDIDETLMSDAELMNEIEANIYEELEPINNFESEADFNDYIAECMKWDYEANEDVTIAEILWRYGYEYDDAPSKSYNIRIRSDLIINADDVINMDVLLQFLSNTAIWIDKYQAPAQVIYTYKTCRVVINFE